MVIAVYGSGQGLALERVQSWYQRVPDSVDKPEAGDTFGYSLVAIPPALAKSRAYLPLILR
jgi:hypothetical protein